MRAYHDYKTIFFFFIFSYTLTFYNEIKPRKRLLFFLRGNLRISDFDNESVFVTKLYKNKKSGNYFRVCVFILVSVYKIFARL